MKAWFGAGVGLWTGALEPLSAWSAIAGKAEGSGCGTGAQGGGASGNLEERERKARIELGRGWWSPNPRPEETVPGEASRMGFCGRRRAEEPAGEGATEPFTCLNF